MAGPSSNSTDSVTSTLPTPPLPQLAVVLLRLTTALLLMPTMPGMGLTLSPDPTPVLILVVSSAFITTIVSTTDYTLNNNIQVVQEK